MAEYVLGADVRGDGQCVYRSYGDLVNGWTGDIEEAYRYPSERAALQAIQAYGARFPKQDPRQWVIAEAPSRPVVERTEEFKANLRSILVRVPLDHVGGITAVYRTITGEEWPG